MPVSTAVATKRGRVTGLKRAIRNGERIDNDGTLARAKQELAVELFAERAERLVAEWTLTDEQIDRLAGIICGGS